jgi:hypothetical protein
MLNIIIYILACCILAYVDGAGVLPSFLFIYQYLYAIISICYFVFSRVKLDKIIVPILLVIPVTFVIEYLWLVVRKLETLGEFHSEAFSVYFFITLLPSVVVYFVAFGVASIILSVSNMRLKG